MLVSRHDTQNKNRDNWDLRAKVKRLNNAYDESTKYSFGQSESSPGSGTTEWSKAPLHTVTVMSAKKKRRKAAIGAVVD